MVDAVGAAVTEFEVGDEVFGLRAGAHAEYVCVPERDPIAPKPAGMTFEEAAAVGDGACIALACWSEAELRPGRSILVYGGSGSIGTAAVQLASHLGAEVTAVCSTKNLELMSSLGADSVIDYTISLRLERHGLRYRLARRSGSSSALPNTPIRTCPTCSTATSCSTRTAA